VIDPARPDFARTPAAEGRAGFGYGLREPVEVPAVSIVTPFLDTDPGVFGEVVRAVERQSLQEWEWLVVDDGSTRTDSLAALAELAARDERVRLLRHPENRGLSAARNTAVAEARAPFVLLLDSDDLIEPTAAEKWLWFLTSYPEYAFVKGLGVGFGAQEYLWYRSFRDGKAFLSRNIVPPTSLIRRDVFAAVGGFDEDLRQGLEDWEFWLRCANAGLWGGTVPEHLDWYRRKPGEAARWANWDEGEGQRRFLAELRGRYPGLWRGGFPRVVPVVRSAGEAELELLPLSNLLVKEKRRLLLLVPWAQVGGADKFNLDLVRELGGRGWEVTVATTLAGDHSWLPELTRLSPDVFACSHFLQPADYPRFLRYLIGSRRPDAILISHSRFAYDALAYLRRQSDCPILDYCHILEPDWLEGGYPRMSVEQRAWLDRQLVSSQALKDWLVAEGAEPGRVEVCYTNIDPPVEPPPSRAQLELPEQLPIVIYPCRIAEQKQPAVFARTIKALHEQGERFLALVVGDGPYLPWLQRYAATHQLPIRFLGPQPNQRTQQLIARSDILFLPSKNEGISLALYEALAAGTPVLSADVGGQRELVSPDTGTLIPPSNPDQETLAYTNALQQLLHNPDQRRQLSANAQQRINNHFRLQQMGDRIHQLLTTTPRQPTTPTPTQAQTAAQHAITNADWAPPVSPPPSLPPFVSALRVRVFAFLVVRGSPLYQLGLRLGLHWLEPLKERFERTVLPKEAHPEAPPGADS
jgi:glycosyltransferase involved in cell wall biosynthesis/GT2 family glycosyltransferase